MSTLSIGTIKSLTGSGPPVVQNSAGTEVGTFCRAWVNFNGTGTVAIRASFGVSSIFDNGVGDYTVNFAASNVMPDANFCAQATAAGNATGATDITAKPFLFTTTSVRMATTSNAVQADMDNIGVAIFR